MDADADAILDRYLSELEAELTGMPASERAEIVLEVRDHFDEARRRLADPSAADLMNILERLGSPQSIAEEARGRPAPPATEAIPAADEAAYGPMEVIVLIAWLLWWPLAVILGALSHRWSRRDKAIAILVELVLFAVVVGLISTPVDTGAGIHLGFVSVLFVIPPTFHGIFSAGFLAWKLANPGPRRWSRAWQIAGRSGLIVLGGGLLWILLFGPALVFWLHSR